MINCDSYHIPAPSPGDPVICSIAKLGVCPDSDCPHYHPHVCDAECETFVCEIGRRECVAWNGDQMEDG
jgi:hypothetical protein